MFKNTDFKGSGGAAGDGRPCLSLITASMPLSLESGLLDDLVLEKGINASGRVSSPASDDGRRQLLQVISVLPSFGLADKSYNGKTVALFSQSRRFSTISCLRVFALFVIA